jgi:hypothetical protein
MSYNHKISDLKFKINKLISVTECNRLIEIYEKYTDLARSEESYKYKINSTSTDNFTCLNLSSIDNPNKDIKEALFLVKKYISIMITNYVLYIKNNKISPSFSNYLIDTTNNIRIIKYDVGQFIEDHTDVDNKNRASCTLNLNEDYEGGEFRLFNGQIKESFKTGDGFIFPAEPIWIHGTEPITKGTRYCINCFLFSSIFS